MNEITSLPTTISGTKCPSCLSTKHTKNGKEKGNQKYKCKTCGKHYRSTTGSSIHHIHKKQLIETYIQCLHQGLTLRKAAEKTGISLKTSFKWRHKLLASLHKKRTSTLNQKTITANLQLPYSEKGKRKKSTNKQTKQRQVLCIIQTDSSGKIHIEIHNKSNKYLINTLRNINEVSVCIPQLNMPKIFKSVKTKPTEHNKKTILLIQNNLRAWIDKFQGVATKYLHHYWAWFELMNDFELSQNPQKTMIEKCLAVI